MAIVMGVSVRGYYAYLERPISTREKNNCNLEQAIQSVYKQNRGLYGSPRIYAVLKIQGYACSRKRVARCMQKLGLRALMNKKFTPRKKTCIESFSDRLQQNFETSCPNSVWAADISYIKTNEGWLYLAVILDLFSRKVIGFSIQDYLYSEIVETALKQAYFRRSPKEKVIHHSDRGPQYTSKSFRKLCEEYAVDQSMNHGSCYDNAVVESFFHTLKTELVHLQNFKNKKEAKMALFEYIEHFYNRKRLHSALGYLSPEQYEQNYEIQKFCVSGV